MRRESVLITGASGFLGSALTRALVAEGHQVIALIRDWTRETPGAVIVRGDVVDRGVCQRVLADYEVSTVYHLAAQSIVSACAEDPLTALEVAVVGTANLLQAVRDTGRSIRVAVSTCYDEKTRAVTPHGLKRYDELRAGDIVFSLDRSGKMVESKIDEVLVHDYSGDVIRFDGKSIDLMVTPNHRMLVEAEDGLRFVEAGTSVPARGWKIPFGKWSGEAAEIQLSGIPHWNANKLPDDVADEDLLYLLGIYIGDGCIQRQTTGTKGQISAVEFVSRPRVKGQFQPLPPEMRAHGRSRGRSNVVFLYIPYKDKARARVEATLNRIGIKWTSWKHGGEGAIYFSSSQLCDLFEQAGKRVYEKHIPRWAMRLPPDKLRCVLDGILDSDGHGGNQIVTSSWLLVQDLIELITKCGMGVSYRKRNPPKQWPMIKGRRIVARDAWDVWLSRRNGESRSILPKMQSRQHCYEGKVWCLRVPPHGNFLVEREGRVMFCGNSDKVYGSSPSPYDESTPLDARHAYEASKACQDIVARMFHHNYDVDVSVVRAVNIYGPGDPNNTRLIPQTVQRLLRGEQPLLHAGAATMRRQYVYVDDVVRAFRTVCEQGVAGEAYCVGSPDAPLSVWEMIQVIARQLGRDDGLVDTEVRERDGRFLEIQEQSVRDDKLRALGWVPEVAVEEGVRRTIEWYKNGGR